ncbi:MAG: hypothetical protein JST16_02370 [Bdellovibrionales bacterium]|nr:hypothetical protein [Bdellovibrionales bacterium]
MSRSKTPDFPWSHWIQRDDRSWLKALSERQWSTEECHKSLGSMLESIVTSLHFSCHSRWGVQPSAERLSALVNEFLLWMKSSGEWTHIEKLWRALDHGPWSLPLALSRAYFRFREERHGEKEFTRSESSARFLAELPAPQGVGVLTDSVMEAFSSLSQQLPENIRLSYQLHLEGLLDHEIAVLIAKKPAEIAEHVREAKAWLGGTLTKRSA